MNCTKACSWVPCFLWAKHRSWQSPTFIVHPAIGVRVIDLTPPPMPDRSCLPTFASYAPAPLLVNASPFFVARLDKLVALAARYALPTMYFRREWSMPAASQLRLGQC